jgi:DNA repair exonuclease SbcCD ATPase subunit
MRLLRLKVDGFGILKGEYAFDPERVTVVLDDNERGKSTLLAAVAAALYGLEGNRAIHRVLTPLDRWRPWDGSPFRIELEVESEGERYTIMRDFDRGTVAVWNGHGQEVTVQFREGKTDFPVGRRLTGLDADEFAKCALVRQDALDAVVPEDERERRGSTLHARLESAADTRGGDTNAAEALAVLEGAVRKYNEPEVDSTGSVDTAITRLELKLATLDTELKTLEHDFGQVAEPLEALARFDEEERSARDRMRGLDHQRRDAIADDVRRQIADNEKHRADLQRLRDEAESLASSGKLPRNAETEFREAVTRHEEAVRQLAALEARKHDELAREREKRESELQGVSLYASASAEDADRCIALASELKQVSEEDASLRTAVFTLRESLASQGHDPVRIQELTARFDVRSETEMRLLRSQSERALVYQSEVAAFEQARIDSAEQLREIDQLRRRWRAPAWLLMALGILAAAAGPILPRFGGPPNLWVSLLGIGGGMLALGLILLISGGRASAGDRTDALRRLTEAQRQINQMRSRRAESEVELGELAAAMGYRDQVDLLREWSEYERVMADIAPALRAQERLAALEARRKTAVSAATAVLAPFGGGIHPQPADLEHAAQAIRQSLGIRKGLAEIEAGWGWLDDERRVAEAKVSGLKERAVRILGSVGLEYDPALSWADHTQALSARMQGQGRYAMLTSELIPQAERRVLPPGKLAELESQLEMIAAERPETPDATARADDPPAPEARATARSPLEIETESRRLRETLDSIQKRRTDVRLEIDAVTRRYHQEHPDKSTQRERVAQALARARRFKAAVELARDTIQKVATDTHQRWADFLNVRIKEVLGAFGTGVEQLRFGEDLDFSVRLPGGQQVSRGKADLQLSAGAKDQLYLAARLAISEYLSRGNSTLPLLLDDPFATSDDGRTRIGMKLLVEQFSPRHQIILLTCHRKRHEALAQLDPDLYARRVQWLELRTAVAR